MANDRIYGIHAVTALLERTPERVVRVIVQKGRQDKKMHAIEALCAKHQIAVEQWGKEQLQKRFAEATHQGVVAEVSQHSSPNYSENDLEGLVEDASQPLLLVLDGIQDPHNLGACLRSADAAGVTAVIVPKDNAASITATVRKVACGAAETVPFITVTNLARTLRWLKDQGVWIYGLAGETETSLYQTDLNGPIALALGAEGKGLRRLTRELCDGLVKIPMDGTVESLNVSVATGISLFEAKRQRG
ncbi:MAG: 23S rRNA (guanosine(2251)-2'-O)-methyltransferase RlmB [Legionellales bacterium]|nr:23S rRNA (guanosine(2251)-2'-O)-methyltransferase RlmB [Legionellales bacterium]|tara:strand:+ start:21089 stop:21829 length:741 start_codon:yes stop_codon:yes gene_type:complete